jgi:hypothetical protein
MKGALLRAVPFLLAWALIAFSLTVVEEHQTQQLLIGIASSVMGVWAIVFRDWLARSSIEQNYKMWGRLLPYFPHTKKDIKRQEYLAGVVGIAFLVFGLLIMLQIMTLI